MEEASVAGESPDRSKQHESSAEPTSGSTAPVPDPRLAVAREAVTAAARVDTATAVFSTRELAASAKGSRGSDGSPESETGRSAGSADEPEAAEEGPAEAAEGGDARLRDAVAAWVAGADEEAPEGASGAGGAASGTSDAASDAADVEEAAEVSDTDAEGSAGRDGGSADTGGSEPEGSASDASSETEGETEPEGGTEVVGESEVGGGAEASSADTGSAVDTDSDSDADSDSEPEVGASAGAEDAGDTEVPTADTATGTGVDADADSGSEREGAAPAEGDVPDEAGAGDDGPVADAKPIADTDAGQEPEDEPKVDTEAQTDATPEAAEPVGEAPGGGEVDAETRADAAPKAAEPVAEAPGGGEVDAEASVDAVPEAAKAEAGDPVEGDAEARGDAVPEDKAQGDGEGGGGTKADAEPADEAPGGGEGDVEAQAGAAPDGAALGDGDADSGSDARSGGEDVAEPPVDQPTAIFKMPARAVDQPTTMLKLGDAKPGAKPKAGPDKGAAAEPGDKPDAGAGKGTAPKPGAESDAKSGESAPPKPGEKPDAGAGKAAAAEPGKDAAGEPGDKAAPAWAAKPSAEPEAERTSKFVALKPLDEPAPPKARPAVPPAAETAAIPQVGPERTTQQPLPPKPPLDLLAELTNTPPPRQTPVRTIMRRVKIWTPLVLLLAVVFAVVQAVRPLPTPTLTLTADESYAFEGSKVSLPWPGEGQGWMDVNGIGTVDRFGEQKPVAIGSVAKAMTAYVILKEHPLKRGEDGEKIPVDAKAETEGGYDAQGESTLNTVKEGDTLTEKDAIAAIMIPSANNIARLLARWDTNGSEKEFVDKMNAAAKDLGMTNTTYTDPSGLKETTVSTAEDQVKLGNELVQMQALVDITKLPTWVDPSGKKWDNYNRLVPYNNAIGIKTGSTTKAGGNLLFAATQDVDGETVIVVGAVLGQHKPPIIDTVNAVSKTAMIAAQEALTSRKILKKGDVVGYVDDGLGGHTPVVATKDVSAVGWAGQTVKLKLSEDGTTIPHEAKAGTKVGSLSVGDGTTGDAVEVPVALQSDLTEPGYGSKFTRVG
ncbi:D-alanyl-D-alanine carboxypeptidase [Streptomyces albicerus]|uniref:D-alanyl-D-alanine carboxypeptidase n=1 Tax=Streptomyces albicerus TaxID=2569859 RepID=UPI00124B4943|nr:D-alanyl-D-alanine carboxypeptidase [Streptomyces albicerus]